MLTVAETILTRRSCRAYTERSISDEDMQALLSAAIYAPSGKNMQDRQFTVLRKRETIAAFARVAATALKREKYDFFQPAALIIASSDPTNPNSGFDCACSLQNIFLMAHSLGIGSCWINQIQYVEDEPAVRQLLTQLGVPADHHVYGLAALGYPAEPPKAVDKSAQRIHFAD